MHSKRDFQAAIQELIDKEVEIRLKENNIPSMNTLTMADERKVPANTATPEDWGTYEVQVWWPNLGKVVGMLEEMVRFKATRQLLDRRN